MTATAAPTTVKPRIRPATVWPVILALFIIVALLAPEKQNDSTDFRITTYSTGPYGARGIYDILTSLGWHTSRWERPLDVGLDTKATYVILQPVTQITTQEHQAIVQMVRDGGRILIASPDSQLVTEFGMTTFGDSTNGNAWAGLSVAGDSAKITHRNFTSNPIFRTTIEPSYLMVRTLPPIPDSLAIFMWRSSRHADSARAPTYMLGRTFGRGRVVVLANPQLASNDIVRQGTPAMAMERALEWLDPPSRQVIFDEYHQGFQGRTDDVVINALTDTPVGRVTLQLVLASLVFLVAIGVRAILPTPVTVLQRRSPREHVDALARAYTQIHATRLGAQRLLRGIRRRHPMGITIDNTARRRDTNSDLDYLDAIRARYGTVPEDIAAFTAALRGPVSDDEFLRAGRAAGRIEQSIITQ